MRGTGQESPQTCQILFNPFRSRFNFQSHTLPARFNHKIHFVPPLDRPETKPGFFPPGVQNGQEILGDIGFKYRPQEGFGRAQIGSLQSGEVAGQTGVADVYFRRLLAAASCGNSSKVTYRRLARPGCFRRKVVFPVWRNPVMTTTGISSRAENTAGAKSR